jgi:hypothetical protein
MSYIKVNDNIFLSQIRMKDVEQLVKYLNEKKFSITHFRFLFLILKKTVSTL